ncbi:MAG: response regulator [Oscillospiraceae bacterium]|nr:response regulator [Oscillospiraceae bacterium]
MMIRAAICDDDNSQISNLKAMLTEWNEHIIITEYTSAEQFLFGNPDAPCDLLLLDNEMCDMNGMELARKLRHNGDMLPILSLQAIRNLCRMDMMTLRLRSCTALIDFSQLSSFA